MSPHAYTEDQLVEQPAIQLFGELGWETISAMEEAFGSNGTLARETKSEVVLEARLHASLQKLNPTSSVEAISSAIQELIRDRSTMSLEAANREIYELLKEGIRVNVADREPSPQSSPKGRGGTGGQKIEKVRIIDWENPKQNDLLLVSQMTVTGQLYTCRPDLIGYVNGLPLIILELKKPGVVAKQAFDENLTSYKHAQNGIPALFWYNALLIASNGTESRVGSLTADWERFFEWKRIEKENEPRRVSLEVMIRGTCEPSRFLDLIENFTLFSEHEAGLVKILGQNHQFLGVNNAIAAALAARAAGHGRGGVFWQTQGSGKSFSMVFFAQKILRKIPGNWTFVIITDRIELDNQIAKTFKTCGAVSETESNVCHAQSGAQLRQLLSENHRYVFTLIHKFQSAELLCDRRDVIVLTDEAHRSQYDTLALNMRSALPNALFLAFTGTPLIAGEERTREVFGDYVSIYDFKQSVEDGATVPLFYENRTPELHLENPNLNEDIYSLIEEAELDENRERRLEQELGRQYHLITRDDRLDVVAKDIVSHFLNRGFQGKAMVISIDKATALRMYDKVKKYWDAEHTKVEMELSKLSPYPGKRKSPQVQTIDQVGSADPKLEEKVRDLQCRLDLLKDTDMAVIVSPGQNEVEQMKAMGLDIVSHRRRMNDEALDESFKDSKDPLRLVFVCAMWLTGFDAPSCSTIYLDKPMRNHTLMQTISRANRVFPGKHSGFIVDYANVFASLEKALAIYGQGNGGDTPVRSKSELVEELRQTIREVEKFCLGRKVDLKTIHSASLTGFERTRLISEAVENLISPDPLRKEFLAHERLLRALFQAVKPDPVVLEVIEIVSCITTIANVIREKTGEGNPGDITAVLHEVNKLLDESIAADGFRIREGAHRSVIDISKIDFEALAKRFSKSKTKHVELEQLKAAIRKQLDKLIRLNKTRVNYLAKFEELIESYNNGSRNLEELFNELVALSQVLSQEQQRHVREHLSEEELTVFDILTRPGPNLSNEEHEEVKKVARGLLAKLKSILLQNWRQTVQARARVRVAIEDSLDEGLPRAYTPEMFQSKVAAVFEHVFESYQGNGASVFTNAA